MQAKSKTRKYLRHTLILILSGTFLSFLVRSVEKYAAGRVAVSVEERFSPGYVFPAVSVCAVITKNITIDDYFNPKGAFDPWIVSATQDSVVKEEGKEPRHIVEHIDYGKTAADGQRVWLDEIILLDDNAILGCNLYQPPQNRKTPSGVRHRVQLTLNNTNIHGDMPMFAASVNHPNHLLPINHLGQQFIHLPAHVAEHADMHNQIRVDLQFVVYKSLSTKHRRCLTETEIEREGEADFKRCFFDYLLRLDDVCLNTSLPNCTERNLISAGEAYRKLESMEEGKFFDEVGCYPPCSLPKYEATVRPTVRIEAKPEEESTVIMSIQAPSPTIVYKSEYKVYDFGSLVGDLGGLLGMLLGMSILALFDKIVDWLDAWLI